MIGASLLLLAGSVLAHESASTRKSLSFGPERPNARFVTDVPRTQSFSSRPRDPKAVALQHLSHILNDGRSKAVEGRDFIFRDDSYTDDGTSVTHLYVRQVVNGIEVADGDISLNIYNGQVISYGDSFYRGEIPGELTNEHAPQDMHLEYCEVQHSLMEDELVDEASTSGQVLLGGKKSSRSSPHPNCNTLFTVFKARENSLTDEQTNVADPKKAALHFMIAAHPSPEVAEEIHDSFNKHLAEMPSTVETSLTGTLSQQVETIHNVPGTIAPVKAKLVYVQSPGESAHKLTLAWKLEVEMTDNWYEAYMDATHPSQIHTVVDWASDAPAPEKFAPIPKEPETKEPSYQVWTWGINDPSEGKRSLVSKHYDTLASPLGWHSIPAANDPNMSSRSKKGDEIILYNTTFGNNVFAHENWEGANRWLDNYRPIAEDLQFVYKYGPKGKDGESVAPKDYANLSITQMFYTSNMFHDLLYRYGFDEKSGNFQQHNFGKGGKEGDAVIANSQDGSGYNNANFMTPPDGQNGRCRMYVWNTATPYRDGDLEAGIVIHELAHGLSTRLTGGPANSGCLGWGESGGMGEGWGDFIASTVRSTSNYSDFPMGAWAANQPGGIRNYPYSTNMTVNPSTYKILDGGRYWGVHAIGEVWAEILWVVEQKLIAKHGFVNTLFPPAAFSNGTVPLGDFYKPGVDATSPLIPKHGNSLLLKLVVDGMKLQPCRPSFFNARDSIIQADQLLTGGENVCELWSGFAERGMGPAASIVGSTPWGGGVRTNDFEVPAGVCK